MQALKELYFPLNSYLKLAQDLKKIYPKIDVDGFYRDAIENLENLELKQRITRAATTCKKYFPDNYQDSLEILYEYCQSKENNFYYLFLTEYVKIYGLDSKYYDFSMAALKEFTKYSSAEEAIRYFLLQDFDKTMKYIRLWSEDENDHVRRLSSEGTRPRLPWAIQLKQVISNPAITLPILESLKEDPSKYVQKSVANHINDISKDNADWVISQVTQWDLDNNITHWIIKHGTRTLIKQGNKEVLKFLGFTPNPKVTVKDFILSATIVQMGDEIEFSFLVQSDSQRVQNLVIDYKLYFMKKNGKQIAKIFKLSNKKIYPKELIKFSKTYLFKDLSTRKHYNGVHSIEVMINGSSFAKQDFALKNC